MSNITRRLARLLKDDSEYRLSLSIVVKESNLQDGWYARLEIETGEISSFVDPEINIARGQDAIGAVQNCLYKLANASSTAAVTLIEAGLLHGEKQAPESKLPAELTEGEKTPEMAQPTEEP